MWDQGEGGQNSLPICPSPATPLLNYFQWFYLSTPYCNNLLGPALTHQKEECRILLAELALKSLNVGFQHGNLIRDSLNLLLH